MTNAQPTAGIVVQFIHGPEDRMSEVFGPYEYVECIYGDLFEPERERMIATLQGNGYWLTRDGQLWSNMNITYK